MSMQEKKTGFGAIFDENSQVLILGSFPSVKSRQISFYYGHKQNRFWPTICNYFSESVPTTVEDKKAFLLRNHIALWDIVSSCEIKGSSDASVRNAEIVDLQELIRTARIEKILLNGSLAYQLFLKKYENLSIPYVKMPSTSPANPHFSADMWKLELNDVFRLY